MRSSTTRKITAAIAAAIAATLIAELTDKILDSVGLSKDDARIRREIIKATAVAVAAHLVRSMLSGSDEAAADIL